MLRAAGGFRPDPYPPPATLQSSRARAGWTRDERRVSRRSRRPDPSVRSGSDRGDAGPWAGPDVVAIAAVRQRTRGRRENRSDRDGPCIDRDGPGDGASPWGLGPPRLLRVQPRPPARPDRPPGRPDVPNGPDRSAMTSDWWNGENDPTPSSPRHRACHGRSQPDQGASAVLVQDCGMYPRVQISPCL